MGKTMNLTLKVWRQKNAQSEGRLETYALQGVDADASFLEMLDILNTQLEKRGEEPVAFEHDCREGICGCCGAVVNGQAHGPLRETTLCQLHMRHFNDGDTIVIEPWRSRAFPLIKDLVVDMEPFFAHYRAVMPYFVNDAPPPADGRERLQSEEDRARFDDTTKCILCACCTTSCPSFWASGRYVGPAAIVQAHRFIFDSRDQAGGERLKILAEPGGVWRCRTIFNCTTACPRDIEVTRAIGEVKLAIVRGAK